MITIGTLVRLYVLNIRTASCVSGSFFVVVGAREVNGIDKVVNDTVDEIVFDRIVRKSPLVVAVSVDITAGIFVVVDDNDVDDPVVDDTDDAPVFVK